MSGPVKDIASVIVLYHPDVQVIRNIERLREITARVYVVDNSELRRPSWMEQVSTMEHVHYLPLASNLGIAAALNVGVQRALTDGFGYVMTMDQDSLPERTMVEAMHRQIDEGASFGILSPVYQLATEGPVRVSSTVQEIESTMTSGNILSLSAYSAVGPFDESLFIDYVDHEYCLRLRSAGYRILQVNDAILHHSWGALQQHTVFGFTFSTSNYAPFRYYYLVRNSCVVASRYWRRFPQFCLRQLLLVMKMVLKSLLLEGERGRRTGFVLRGLIDCFRGRSGRLT